MFLVDADLFLSADRTFVDMLTEVRRQAPFTFAEPKRITASNSWTDNTIAVLDSWPVNTDVDRLQCVWPPSPTMGLPAVIASN
jgi:hypothetical protein